MAMYFSQRLRRFARELLGRFSGAPGAPEHLLERMIDDIDEQLDHARAEVIHYMSESRRIGALRSEARLRAENMLNCARQALRLNQEDLAREAIVRHLHALHRIRHYTILWRQYRDGGARLQQLLADLEVKRADLEHRRQLLVARRQMAQTRRSLLRSLYDGRSREQVERAEDEVLTQELTSNAYESLKADGISLSISALALDDATDSVERLLTQLRSELALPAHELSDRDVHD